MKMKKILMVMLAFLLVLAFASGCGKDDVTDGSSDSASDAGSDTGSGTSADGGSDIGVATPAVWPAEDFPAGFPEYTDGTVIATEAYDGGVTARISGTSESAVSAYVSALEAAGWEIYSAEGNAEGTTLMQEKDETTYLIVYLGFVNDDSGDFVVSVSERAAQTDTAG